MEIRQANPKSMIYEAIRRLWRIQWISNDVAPRHTSRK